MNVSRGMVWFIMIVSRSTCKQQGGQHRAIACSFQQQMQARAGARGQALHRGVDVVFKACHLGHERTSAQHTLDLASSWLQPALLPTHHPHPVKPPQVYKRAQPFQV